MSRAALILVLLSGVAVTSTADAKPKTSKKKKAKAENRTPTRSTKANMPRGFTWPPNKHMTEMGEECTRSLESAGITFEATKAKGRVLTPMLPPAEINGVTFTPVYAKNQIWDCQLLSAVATFAPTLHELGVREVKYGSAFRWSKVRVSGRTKNILSRHALGIALDIVSFVDADGNEAIVKKHYRRGNDLLLGVEKAVNSSGAFRLLLTPKNDPKSHHDHFHLEANPDYSTPVSEKPAS